VFNIAFTLLYYLYPGFFNYTLSVSAASVIGFIFGSYGAAVLFPFKMKDVYERSPIAKYKVAGVPVITILGAWGVGWLVYILYMYFTEPQLGIESTPSEVLIFLTFAGCAVAYFIAKWYKAKHGIDISLAFKLIPPD